MRVHETRVAAAAAARRAGRGVGRLQSRTPERRASQSATPTGTQTGVIATDPKDSQGPAAEVPGAPRAARSPSSGRRKISHLDPQRVYSFAGLMNAPLYARFLTTWKDDGKGSLTLVGDLAETPGKNVNNDCKVWEFTIKDGLKFEDGRPITSKEIAYGIARSFDPDLTGGPTYLQEWLADTPQFDTAWDFKANKTSLPPGLTTPDAKTLRLRVRQAALRPAVRGVAADHRAACPPTRTPASTTTSSRSRPARTRSPRTPRASSSYSSATPTGTRPPTRSATSTRTSSSGPSARTADAAANRIIADNGADQSAIAWNGVPASLVAKVAADPALQGSARCSRRRPAPTG